jgi:hypothetical protein
VAEGRTGSGTGSGNFLFRVGKEAHTVAVKRHGAKAMVHNGRRMEGFIWVDPEACDARGVKAWVRLATAYVGKLPVKNRRQRPA